MIVFLLTILIIFFVIKIISKYKKNNELYENIKFTSKNNIREKKIIKKYCPLSLSLDDPVMDGFNIGKMDNFASTLQEGNLVIKQTVKYPKPYENFIMPYQK